MRASHSPLGHETRDSVRVGDLRYCGLVAEAEDFAGLAGELRG